MERRCYCHPSLAPLSYCKRQSRGLVRASAGEYVVIFLTIIYFCVQDRKSWEMARTADWVVWNKGGIIVSRCPTQGQNLPHKSFWGQKIVFGNVNALLSRSTVGKQSKDLCLPPNHKQPNHQKNVLWNGIPNTCILRESRAKLFLTWRAVAFVAVLTDLATLSSVLARAWTAGVVRSVAILSSVALLTLTPESKNKRWISTQTVVRGKIIAI